MSCDLRVQSKQQAKGKKKPLSLAEHVLEIQKATRKEAREAEIFD
jgi:hypothetical protein